MLAVGRVLTTVSSLRVARAASAAGVCVRVRSLATSSSSPSSSALSFATVDPESLSGARVHTVSNLISGVWQGSASYESIIDPLNGEPMLRVPTPSLTELQPVIDNLAAVPRYGLHNAYLNPERYLLYGDVCMRTAERMREPAVERFLARMIQRTSPKSYGQALGEVTVTRKFFENFAGDNVRFLARGFSVAGNHTGQMSTGNRWPFGPVGIVSPFNFPIEIPTLQLVGALLMGNKPVLKVDSKVSVCMEQVLRLMIECGMPAADVEFVNCTGPVMNELLLRAPVQNVQFTGSSRVSEKLSKELHGRVRVEDSGFDWKLLGPDVANVEYVAWQSDQDAYASSGQKCSAQSLLVMHDNWAKTDLVDRMRTLAARRTLADLTIGPVLTVTTERMKEHVGKLLAIPGAKLLFGGKELANHRIPKVYGAFEPTAVFVPLEQAVRPENFALVSTEVFGPVQVVTSYGDAQLDTVLSMFERLSHHLTAAVVSNDPQFVQYVLARSLNGTTYAGARARTTGAPQNHWFGPAGDPRGAGIGSPEAILHTWSCHREIIYDVGPVPSGWKTPASS